MLKHCPNIQGYHYCDCQEDCQIRKELTMAEQTAVEWLIENIQKVHKMDWDIVFIQAKAIEKEQIINAFNWAAYEQASNRELDLSAAEVYYNKKYKQ